MPTIENPAVLQETSITFASGIHPGGEASPYAVLRFVAHQRGPDQRMEKLELPPLWVERQALQALADLLVRALERFGAEASDQDGSPTLQ